MFISFSSRQKLRDNSMAHSQILIQTQCVLSFRIPVILTGRGDFQNRSPLKAEKHAAKFGLFNISQRFEDKLLLKLFFWWACSILNASWLTKKRKEGEYLKIPARWIEKWSQSTQMRRKAVVEVFVKPYGCTTFIWLVATLNHDFLKSWLNDHLLNKQATFFLSLHQAYYFPALSYSCREITITHHYSIYMLNNAAKGEFLSWITKGNLYVASISLSIVLLVFLRINEIIIHHVKRSMLCVKKVLCGKEDASQLARRQLACQLFLLAKKKKKKIL